MPGKAIVTSGERQVATVEDVDAEERLRFQALLLEAIADSVIFTDLEGRIQYWNRGAEALFGYTAAEMMGQTPAKLYPTSGDDLLADDLKAIMEGHEYVATWQGRRKDGSDVWVDIKTGSSVWARMPPRGSGPRKR
jgi:PAS domain S-box-containing protein